MQIFQTAAAATNRDPDCVSLVLPAGRLEAVQGQESAYILYRGADRHRFGPALLFLPYFFRGRSQSAGKPPWLVLTFQHILFTQSNHPRRSLQEGKSGVPFFCVFFNHLFTLLDSLDPVFGVTGSSSLCQNPLLFQHITQSQLRKFLPSFMADVLMLLE